MNQNEDPYEVLGVPRDASPEEIKSSYRRAALQTHPDKCSESERATATEKFARLSNAYEVLSDPARKRQYDATVMDDRSRYYYHHFHDPFQIFERVFREEFGGTQYQQEGKPSSRHRGFYDRDPFFGGARHPFLGGNSREDLFSARDPFFGGRHPFEGFFGQGGGFFGDRMFRDTFDEMQRMPERLDRQQQNGTAQDRGSKDHNHMYFSSSSTRSSTTFGGNGESVTTVTTTRRVNGKEQTVTERIVKKPDGTVERQVKTSGDPELSLPAPPPSSSSSSLADTIKRRNSGRLPRSHRALPAAQDPFSRRFGMTPEQREQLKDNDEPTPTTAETAHEGSKRRKSRWFWW